MTNSRLYKISAWKDNGVKIVLTQNEGSPATNPTYNKRIRFQCYDSDGLITIPDGAEIMLAIDKPDNTTDLLAGSLENNSDISFSVKNTLTACAGIVKGEIRIIAGSSVVKFYGINFNIYRTIDDNGAIGSAEFDELIKALQKVVNVTVDGSVANLDSVIKSGGTNPVASGIIYDYLQKNVENYVTNVSVDDAVSANTVYRVYTGADGLTVTGYHRLIAVPATNEITQYLFTQDGKILHRYCLAQNGYKSSSWLNWERIANYSDVPKKVSDLLNDKGYLVAADIAGKADKANVYTKTESDTKYEKVDNKQQSIDTNRRTTTADATYYPSVAAVKDFAFGNFYTQNEIDETISQIVPYEIKYTLSATDWKNKKQEIDLPYTITATTRIDIVIDNLETLQNVWSGTGLVIEYDEHTHKTYAEYLTWDYLTDEIPPIDIELTLRLTEVNTIG